MTNINNSNGAVKYDEIYEAGIAHILGLDLIVGPEVFIPRPSGIFLIQQADVYIKKNGGDLKVADFGSGTGFLSIALKRANPNINVTAFEKSSQAYAYLLKNIEKYEYDITPVKMDVINNEINDFDLIVSDAPFTPEGLNRAKMRDPLLSLNGIGDGLSSVNTFIEAASKSLKSGGYFMIYHLKLQTDKVVESLQENFTNIQSTDHPLMSLHGDRSIVLTCANLK